MHDRVRLRVERLMNDTENWLRVAGGREVDQADLLARQPGGLPKARYDRDHASMWVHTRADFEHGEVLVAFVAQEGAAFYRVQAWPFVEHALANGWTIASVVSGEFTREQHLVRL